MSRQSAAAAAALSPFEPAFGPFDGVIGGGHAHFRKPRGHHAGGRSTRHLEAAGVVIESVSEAENVVKGVIW